MNKQCRTEFDGDKYEQVINLIKREFQNEINKRQEEVHLIQKRLLKAKKSIHLLKYVVIKSFYDNKELNKDEFLILSGKQSAIGIQNRMHPAVKKLLGKKPIDFNLPLGRSREKTHNIHSYDKIIEEEDDKVQKNIADNINFSSNTNQLVSKKSSQHDEIVPRGNQKKTKHEIIVGNISKYSPSNNELDKSSHKWMIYVRGPRNNPDISHFVKKIRFFLHPSYRPNDVIEIEESPFHLSRRGWGEFPVRVQIHFQTSYNKPIDIIHKLKLDQTRSGRQTLGNETLLNVWLYNNILIKEENENFQSAKRIKQEIIDNNETGSNIKSSKTVQDYCPEPSTSKSNTNYMKFQEKEINIIHNEFGFQVIKNESTNDNEFEPTLNSNNSFNSFLIKMEDDVDNEEFDDDSNILSDTDAIYDENKSYLIDHCYTEEIIHDNFISSTQKYSISIPLQRFKSTRQIVYFLFKSLPLITHLALNLTYKCCYPYVAVSLEEFASWNIGKQRCSEWYRAKEIKDLLILHNIPDQKLWTMKFIIMVGRAYAFIPFANYKIFRTNKECAKTIPNQQNTEPTVYSTYTEFIPISKLMENKNMRDENNIYNCVLDVENLNIDENEQVKEEVITKKNKNMSSETNNNLNLACTYIKDCAEEMDITLEDEEILPNVLHNTAERVLLKAVMCLAEELIRSAWANKVIANKGRNLDYTIDRNDIYKVLLEREEFDIFTNDGLGKNV